MKNLGNLYVMILGEFFLLFCHQTSSRPRNHFTWRFECVSATIIVSERGQNSDLTFSEYLYLLNHSESQSFQNLISFVSVPYLSPCS